MLYKFLNVFITAYINNILIYLSSLSKYQKYIRIVHTNLIARVSRIPGHEIRIVLYTLWDGGNCRLYKADYVVYILMRLPPNWSVLQKCTRRVSGWLVHQTRKHAVGTTGAVIIQEQSLNAYKIQAYNAILKNTSSIRLRLYTWA